MDPLAEKYYAWSPYAYVANNPMRLIDPDGKDWRNPQHWKRFAKNIYKSTKVMLSAGLQLAGEIKTTSAPVGANLNVVSMDLIGIDNGTVRPNKDTPKITSEFELGYGILGISNTKSVEEGSNNSITKESTQTISTLFVEYQDQTTSEYTENRKGESIETKSSSKKGFRVPDLGFKVAAIIGVEVKIDPNKIWDALGKLLIDKKSDDN